MTDPGLQGMHDDGRDLRAALGGLLTDEPTAPWSVQDDVRRGEALRTRRRTRTLGTVGIAAALALVVGVLGPWGVRPLSAPPAASPSASPGFDKDAVSALLNQLGWDVTGVAEVRQDPNPTVTKWSVSKGDGNINASLTIRTWTSGGSAAPTGSVLEACTGDKSCEMITATIADCVGSPCWSSRSTTITKGDDVTPAGTAVLLTYDETTGVAVEIVATPTTCATCSTPVGVQPAFLSDAQQQQFLALLKRQLAPALTTPTPEPSTPAVVGEPCRSGDVKLIPGADPVPGPPGLAQILVTVQARNPDVDCVIEGHPIVVGLDRDGGTLAYTPTNTGIPQQVRVTGQNIAVFRVATSICAPVGGDLATLRVTLAGGGAPADVSVAMFAPAVSCGVGPAPSTDMVIGAYEPAAEATPASDPTKGAPGVAEYLKALGITVSGGPDFAGKGPVGDGGQYAGEYLLRDGGRTAAVTVRLELGRLTSPVVSCQGECSDGPTASSGTDTSGLAYEQSQAGLASSTSYGPRATRVLQRLYGDLLMMVAVQPWSGSTSSPLTAEQLTDFADAFAAEARAAVGVPALPVASRG